MLHYYIYLYKEIVMLNTKNYISNEEKFLYGFFLSFLIGILLSTLLRFYRHDYFISILNIIIIMVTLSIIYHYEKEQNYTLTVLNLFWLTSLSIFVYIVHLDYSVHIFMAILIPLAASILLNTKDFVRHNSLFLLLFTAVMVYGFIHKERYIYLNDSSFIIGFILLFFFIIVFSFVYHTAIKKSYTQLQKAHQQQEFLLKEIHHRVKNNLNMITSILGLQENTAKTENMRIFIEQNSLRIKSIALVHELLYQEKNFSSINIDTYIRNLVEHIISIGKYNAIEVIIDIEEVGLTTDDIIHIGIIINELMTNSLKYAFDEHPGRIDISLKQVDDDYILYYKDNGKGIDEAHQTHTGFGFKLINLSVKQLHGSLKTYSKRGLHTQISFIGAKR